MSPRAMSLGLAPPALYLSSVVAFYLLGPKKENVFMNGLINRVISSFTVGAKVPGVGSCAFMQSGVQRIVIFLCLGDRSCLF